MPQGPIATLISIISGGVAKAVSAATPLPVDVQDGLSAALCTTATSLLNGPGVIESVNNLNTTNLGWLSTTSIGNLSTTGIGYLYDTSIALGVLTTTAIAALTTTSLVGIVAQTLPQVQLSTPVVHGIVFDPGVGQTGIVNWKAGV